MPGKLIIFDYSGSLSPEMAAFARPDNLQRHLEKSGLSALGVESTALFWEIINATWEKGSTTKAGYNKVLQDHVCQLFQGEAQFAKTKVVRAVSDFADAYFRNSSIDPRWRPVLEMINNNKSVQVIIATDHYAEATDVIIKNLDTWNIKAAAAETRIKSNFLVASSADIGVHKTERKFWEIIKKKCTISANQILLIDDFGQNEQQGDNYNAVGKFDVRRGSTIEMLHDVFNADVEFFYFIAGDKRQDELIAEASAAIDEFLSARKVTRSMID